MRFFRYASRMYSPIERPTASRDPGSGMIIVMRGMMFPHFLHGRPVFSAFVGYGPPQAGQDPSFSPYHLQSLTIFTSKASLESSVAYSMRFFGISVMGSIVIDVSPPPDSIAC
jgi:hypothetical protein